MKIHYVTGDLFETECPIILHGCNARGRMGSGVAKIIREKFPKAYEEYRNRFENHGLVLGEVIFANCDGKIIANGITQSRYGQDGKRYVSYKAINTVVEAVNEYARMNECLQVAMPLIGAGLGGGSWTTISEIIEKRCVDVAPVVYTLDGIIPK